MRHEYFNLLEDLMSIQILLSQLHLLLVPKNVFTTADTQFLVE